MVNFIIIEDSFYNQLIDLLAAAVPEFIPSFEKEFGPYLIFGEFYHFVLEHIENPDVKLKAFDFINFTVENGGYEMEDMIAIQFFEPICMNYILLSDEKKLLNGKALKVFLIMLSYY